jgi:hypothetical protein
MLGQPGVDQRAAQAAAWYLNNRISWRQMAAWRIPSAGSASRPYFTPSQLRAARKLATRAVREAQRRRQPRTTPPGG